MPRYHQWLRWFLPGLALACLIGGLSAQADAPAGAPTPPPGLEVGNPDVVQFERGNGLYQSRNWAEALAAFSEALPNLTDSRKEEALFRIGDCYRQLGRTAEALGVYALALKTYPDSIFASTTEFYVGQLNFQSNQNDLAMEAFKRSSNKGDAPTQDAARFYVAMCQMRLKQYAEAVPVLQEYADKKGSFTIGASQALATYDQQLGNWADALKYWRKVLDQSPEKALQVQAAAQGGWVALQAGHVPEAEALFVRSRQIDPKSDWTRLSNTGLIQIYFQLARYKEVIDCYNKYRESLLLSSQAEIQLNVARSYFRINDPFDASQAYDVFLSQFKNHPAAPLAAYERLLARQQISQDNVSGDAASFLATYPKSEFVPYISFLRAYDFSRRRQFSEALPLWTELWKTPPANVPPENILSELIRAQLELHNWSEVVVDCTVFIQKYPGNAAALGCRVNRAVANQTLGRTAEALAAWKDVREHAPAGSGEGRTADEQTVVLLAGTGGEDLMAACRDLLKNYPQSNLRALAAYTLGAYDFEKNNYDEAEPFLRHAREWDPKAWGISATYRLTWIAFSRKDMGTAMNLVSEYDRAIEGDAKAQKLPATLYYWIGLQCAAKNQYAEAIDFFNQTLAQPDSGKLATSTWWEMGEAYRKLKNWKQAVKCYDFYTRLDPPMADSTVVLLSIAEAHTGAELWFTAKEAIDKLLLQEPEGPRNAQARILLAEWNAAQKNFVEAAKSYSTLALIYQDKDVTPRAMFQAAEMWDKAGDPGQSASWRTRLSQQFPNYKPE